MSNALEINGKELRPIKDVASLVSYSRDYITRLAREGKIVATQVGRQWYVDVDSLNNYAESASIEQELRRKQLREERKLEQIANVAARQNEVAREQRSRTLKVKAVMATALVLALGASSGWAAYTILSFNHPNPALVANTANTANTPAADVVTPESKLVAVQPEVADTRAQVELLSVASSSVRVISHDIEKGVLLLPHGVVDASAVELFSDDVMVMTGPDGTQAVVRVDEYGRPTGEVIPFVVVPVNQGSN